MHTNNTGCIHTDSRPTACIHTHSRPTGFGAGPGLTAPGGGVVDGCMLGLIGKHTSLKCTGLKCTSQKHVHVGNIYKLQTQASQKQNT